jgi:hypothetical protein
MNEWRVYKFGRFEYKISDDGNVVRLPCFISNGKSISLRKEKVLKGTITNKGYSAVELDGKHHFIHRLVATLFIENPNSLPQVNHKDGNKLNNNVNNLEWCTNEDNMRHAYENGFQYNGFGRDARNFKYEYICLDRLHIGKMTSMEFAKIFKEEGLIKNVKSCSSNIRNRLKVCGYNFEKVRKVGEQSVANQFI